jgi:hypothetical protein
LIPLDKVRQGIIGAAFADNPRSRRLQGRPGYRLQIGDNKAVLDVGHRRDIYRQGWEKCAASKQRSTA